VFILNTDFERKMLNQADLDDNPERTEPERSEEGIVCFVIYGETTCSTKHLYFNARRSTVP